MGFNSRFKRLTWALFGITVHYTTNHPVPCTNGYNRVTNWRHQKLGWELLGPKEHESLLLAGSNRENTIGQGYNGFWLVGMGLGRSWFLYLGVEFTHWGNPFTFFVVPTWPASSSPVTHVAKLPKPKTAVFRLTNTTCYHWQGIIYRTDCQQSDGNARSKTNTYLITLKSK